MTLLGDQHSSGRISEQRIRPLVLRIHDPAQAIDTHHQRQLGIPRRHILRSGHHRVHEPGTGRRQIERRTVETQTILQQTRRGGTQVIGRHRSHDQQVDVLGVHSRSTNRSLRSCETHVERRDVNRCLPPFQDPRAFTNPVRIETESLVQFFVRDHIVGNKRPGTQDLHAGQRSRPLAGQNVLALWKLAFGHRGTQLGGGSPASPSSLRTGSSSGRATPDGEANEAFRPISCESSTGVPLQHTRLQCRAVYP
jgi:hypothetical protein